MVGCCAYQKAGQGAGDQVRVMVGPVEYVVFADEGHGFVKRENEKTGYEAVLKFLDTHLKGTPKP